MEICPGKGVLKKRGFQTPGNTLTGESVVRLETSEDNISRRKNKLKKYKPTDYMPNGNSQWGSSTDTCIRS